MLLYLTEMKDQESRKKAAGYPILDTGFGADVSKKMRSSEELRASGNSIVKAIEGLGYVGSVAIVENGDTVVIASTDSASTGRIYR